MLYHLLFIKILLIQEENKVICEKLKEIIPNKCLEVPVQVMIMCVISL